MADRQLQININADISKAQKALTTLSNDFKQFGGQVVSSSGSVAAAGSRLTRVFQTLGSVFFAGQIINQIKQLGTAFLDMEKQASAAGNSLAITAQIAKNLGHNIDISSLHEQIVKLASSARGGGYALDDFYAAAQNYAAANQTQAQIMGALALNANVAAGSQRDFTAVTLAQVKAIAGVTTGLTRLGIVMKDANGKVLEGQAAYEMLAKTFHDSAEVRAQSLAAQLTILQNNFQGLKETLGSEILPMIMNVVGAMDGLIQGLEKTIPLFGKTGESGKQLSDNMKKTADQFQSVGEWIGKLIGWFIALVRTVVTAGDVLLATVRYAVDNIVAKLQTMAEASKAAFDTLFDPTHAARHLVELRMAIADFADQDNLTRQRITGDWKNAFKDIAGYWTQSGATFRPTGKGGTAEPPKFAEFDKGGGAEKAASNAVANALAALTAFLQYFKDKVTDAKIKVDQAAANLELFKANLPGGAVTTAAQADQEHDLVAAQAAAEKNLRGQIANEIIAEEVKAKKYLVTLEAQISTHLKNHDELIRKIAAAAHEHARAAKELRLEYTLAAKELAKIAYTQTVITRELNAHLYATGQKALTEKQNASDRSFAIAQEDLRVQEHGLTSRNASPTELAGFAIKKAELEKAMDDYRVTIAQEKLDNAKAFGLDEEITAARDALTNAQLTDVVALHNLTAAQMDYQKVVDSSKISLQNFWDALSNKIASAVPGLTAGQHGPGSLSLNPMQFLIGAFEQTKTFGDIMREVTGIVKAFAKVMDALRPIIDAVIKALNFVLRLFGLNVTGGDKPFFSITHDTPTLQELKSGNIGPLSNIAQTGDTLFSPVTSALNSGFSVLKGLLVAILAAITISSISHMFGGGGGGIFGGLAGLLPKLAGFLGMGGGAGGGPLAAAQAGAQIGFSNALADSGVQTNLATSFSAGLKSTTSMTGLGGAAAGIGAGQALAGALGENQTGAAIGGVIGSIAGSIIPGVGTMIGGLVGSLIGGLFGGHKKTGPQLEDVSGNINRSGMILENQLGTAANNFRMSVTKVGASLASTLTAVNQANSRLLQQSISMNTSIHGNINGYSDLNKLATDMASATQRATQMRRYDMSRGVLG